MGRTIFSSVLGAVVGLIVAQLFQQESFSKLGVCWGAIAGFGIAWWSVSVPHIGADLVSADTRLHYSPSSPEPGLVIGITVLFMIIMAIPLIVLLMVTMDATKIIFNERTGAFGWSAILPMLMFALAAMQIFIAILIGSSGFGGQRLIGGFSAIFAVTLTPWSTATTTPLLCGGLAAIFAASIFAGMKWTQKKLAQQ